MNSGWGSAAPLLSQEGWRTAPGWFRSEPLQQHGFGTTPRVIAMQSRCPPNLGGQFPLHLLIQFIHSSYDRPRRRCEPIEGNDELPSLAKEGWPRHQENGPNGTLLARTGWLVQSPRCLDQPPRLPDQ